MTREAEESPEPSAEETAQEPAAYETAEEQPKAWGARLVTAGGSGELGAIRAPEPGPVPRARDDVAPR
jgi:hypothetical protein